MKKHKIGILKSNKDGVDEMLKQINNYESDERQYIRKQFAINLFNEEIKAKGNINSKI